MIQKIIWMFFYVFLCVCLLGCNDNSGNSADSQWIVGLDVDMEFPMEGGIQESSFTLANGLDASQITCAIPAKDQAWCEALVKDNRLMVYVYRSYVESERYTDLTIEYGKELTYSIRIKQVAGISENDVKIPVMAGTADTENRNNEMDKSFDGDYKTYFNSMGGIDVTSTFRMTYTLESGHTLYRIVYTPRTDNNKWGAFNKFDVEVATEDASTKFVKVASFERGDGVFTPLDFQLDKPVANAKYVRFTIHSNYMKRVSCAEMEFYEPSKNAVDYNAIFADPLYTKLKEGVTEQQIKNLPDNELRSLALALLSDSYDCKYRIAEYRPYQSPSVMASLNRTSRYSPNDNATGIYAVAGEKIYVAMDEPYEGAQISLTIRDLNGGYGNARKYTLEKGLNVLQPAVGGLIYINNHVDDAIPLVLETEEAKQLAAAKTVKIHFIMGKVNGYFDRLKNTSEEWADILKNAKYQDIDMLGTYAHVVWRVSDLIKYNTDAIALLDNFDKLVYWEQDFIGLVKYNRMFNNRLLFTIDYAAKSPNASNDRTVYPDGNAKKICDTNNFGGNCWGPAHEAGHVNQTSPGLKWLGTTEVTNNILSMYVQASFNQPSRLAEVYANAQKHIVEAHVPHNGGGDLFERLVPFWQLKLYIVEVLGQKDFYRDLYEYFRTYNYEPLNAAQYTEGVYQLDFVRQVCRISGLNLLDFFEKWGFLYPIDKDVNDYRKGRFTITQEQIDLLKQEIDSKGYAVPHPNVHLITEINMSDYQK